MATVADTLITEYKLNNAQYLAAAKQVTAATAKTGKQLTASLGTAAKTSGDAFASLGHGITSTINQIPLLGTMITGLAAGVAALTGYAMAQGAELESLTLGLQNYAGSAEETQKQLARLKEVAKLPGLGFKEAIEGSIRLQAVGFDARLAERALMGFGNALASVGKGKAELDGVIVALGQIVSKGTISAEEIAQIAERVPQIRQLMTAAFGSANTEELTKRLSPQQFISGIIDQLEKLPKAPNAAKNFFENVADVGFRAFASIGTVLNKVLLPPMEKVVNFVGYLTDSGAFERITKGLIGLTGAQQQGDSPLVKVLAYVAATLEEMPNILKGLVTVFQGVYAKAIAFVNGLVSVLKDVGGSAFGRLIGLGKLAALTSPFGDGKKTLAGFDQLGQSQASVEKRAQGFLKGFGQQGTGTTADQQTLDKGGFTVAESIKSVEQTNKQIADNTKKALDLQRSIIGGGQVADASLSGVRVAEAGGVLGEAEKLILKGMKMLRQEATQEAMNMTVRRAYNYR